MQTGKIVTIHSISVPVTRFRCSSRHRYLFTFCIRLYLFNALTAYHFNIHVQDSALLSNSQVINPYYITSFARVFQYYEHDFTKGSYLFESTQKILCQLHKLRKIKVNIIKNHWIIIPFEIVQANTTKMLRSQTKISPVF